MFRNPRENISRTSQERLPPSIGRPPSPPKSPETLALARDVKSGRPVERFSMATKMVRPGGKGSNGKATPAKKTLGATSGNSSGSAKTPGKQRPNGSILSFFKKEEQGLFVDDNIQNGSKGVEKSTVNVEAISGDADDDMDLYAAPDDQAQEAYHENGESVKRRKVSGDISSLRSNGDTIAPTECTPPPPPIDSEEIAEADADAPTPSYSSSKTSGRQKSGPFAEDSDSDVDETSFPRRRASARKDEKIQAAPSAPHRTASEITTITETHTDEGVPELPQLNRPTTNDSNVGDFEEFEGMIDFDDEELEGEEYQERRYMAEQRRLEMAEAGFEGDTGGFDDFPDEELLRLGEQEWGPHTPKDDAPACPICSASLKGISDQDASVHVNNCLDGNPSPLPEWPKPQSAKGEIKLEKAIPRFQRKPPKPGQENPIVLDGTPGSAPASAFSKLMSNHAEDIAWASAAAAENASRGKPAFQRTCPFYKIMPGMSICVDAFRYGDVKDCNAYFLSHFHSDHYIGLTANWSHGPIFCSRVTANLVRTQLRVDPKHVVDLEFEKKTEVPGTQGVFVTMIPANHCPGSSLFLFEKVIGKGKNPKVQRILHCGDFRACRAHVEHPLLKPDVVDSITGQTKQQKIDICYLDTTYLNPKYAFPSQEEVIKACGDMCVSLNKVRADESDGWEQMKRDRAGAGMIKFVQKELQIKDEADDDENIDHKPDASTLDAMSIPSGPTKPRGRLLVVVGTYSIGKERVCLGIAKALDSKIYAPSTKMRICACLEDPELNARLTSNPREAQVHMTPLFEIRPDTLDDYLKDFRDTFSRAVGFRPTGWNYRPPNSRFVESPAVSNVLRGQNWKSTYSMRELVPQRGSTNRASCFGVPYSEHSSFRELTMFCCALRIDKVVPTVNVGSARSREKMRSWVERWAAERKKNGLFKVGEDGAEW
ncbi:DRMBL-domain-containing protein [Rhizodiscina lignyota]|uniref:DRMBL-domain-containing protein n=1 Tax=Rhizodiscina lignyota TaxID=1504668 RepID=A0A9P4IHQ7_9PEZI|nr:DRMBL-domain-containing protein [Rhizodiscina lignyota]